MRYPAQALVTALAAGALVLTACGGGGRTTEPVAEMPMADAGGLTVVATTTVLGDVTRRVVGDHGTVEVLMAPGQDAHGFSPSAQQARALREADLVVANGLQLEEMLVAALEAAEADGVTVLHVAEHLDPLTYAEDHDEAHDDHDHAPDDDHAHDDHAPDDDHDHAPDDDHDHGPDDHDDAHDHGEFDPHVWFDPIRMAEGARVIAAALAEVDDTLEAEAWRARGDEVAREIEVIDAEVARILDAIPSDCRRLVTNHDSFGYLAARYDLEVLATVIPGASTQVETSARWFAELAELLRDTRVPAIFSENVQSTRLADALVAEVGHDLQVVELYTESLGEPGSGAETWADMMIANATRIADALGDC